MRRNGHIRERSPGAFELRYSLGTDLATGKRRIATTTVKGNRRVAAKELRRLLRTLDTGEHVDPLKMAVQQQHLDERSGACGIPVGSACGSPKRLMLGGEHVRCAGLRQRCRPWQRTGLAQQDLQIVVQLQDFGAFTDRAVMVSYDRITVIDSDFRG